MDINISKVPVSTYKIIIIKDTKINKQKTKNKNLKAGFSTAQYVHPKLLMRGHCEIVQKCAMEGFLKVAPQKTRGISFLCQIG